jgi:hypothetical protein
VGRLQGRLARLEQETPALPPAEPVWSYEELVRLPPRLLRLLCDLHTRPDPAAVAELAGLSLDELYRRFRLELVEQRLECSSVQSRAN